MDGRDDSDYRDRPPHPASRRRARIRTAGLPSSRLRSRAARTRTRSFGLPAERSWSACIAQTWS